MRCAILVLMALVMGWGCTPKQGGGDARVGAGSAVMHSAAAVNETTPLNDVLVARMPDNALVVAAVEGVDALVFALGTAKLAAQLPEPYGRFLAESMKGIGFDPLTAQGWAGLGVDVSAPFGVALIHLDKEQAIGFAHLSDPKAFEAGFRRIMAMHGERVVLAVHGERRILSVEKEEDLAFVIEGHAVFACFSDRGRLDEVIALLKRERTLGTDEAFLAAKGDLTFGRHAALYVNTRALGELVADTFRSSGHERYLARALQRAKESRDPQRIARAQRRFDEAKPSLTERAKRAVTVKFVRGLFSTLGGIVVGARVEGPALRAKLSMRMKPGALPLKLLRAFEATPLLLRGLSHAPIGYVAGRIDPVAALETIRLVAAASGEAKEMRRSDEVMRAELGFGLKALVGKLSGEAGFAVLKEGVGQKAALGGAFTLGFRDQAAGLEVMKAFEGPARRMLQPQGEGRYRLSVPYWREVSLAVKGGEVVVSSDEAGFEALLAGKGPGFATAPKGLAELLGRDGASALGWLALGELLLLETSYWGEGSTAPVVVLAVPEGIPAAPEARAAKVQALRDRRDYLNEQEHYLQAKASYIFAATLGTIVARVDTRGERLTAEAGWFLNTVDVPAFTVEVFRMAFAASQQQAHEEVSKIYERIHALSARQ